MSVIGGLSWVWAFHRHHCNLLNPFSALGKIELEIPQMNGQIKLHFAETQNTTDFGAFCCFENSQMCKSPHFLKSYCPG